MATPNERERALDEMRGILDRDRRRFDDRQPGAMVAGTVVDVREVEGTFSRYLLVTVDDGTELVELHCGRSVLANELGGRDVRPGDLLGVKYDGPKVSRSGTQFHGYTVVHRPASEAERIRSVHDADAEAFPAGEESF